MARRRAKPVDAAAADVMLGAGVMTIIDAMDSPALFGSLFDGPSWNAWRCAVKGLFGLPMDDDEAETFRKHTGRTMLPSRQFTEAALVCGRRAGKSRIVATIAVFLATFKDYAPFLAPGEVGTVAVIAADRRQARQILRYALGLLRANATLAAMITGETAESIELAGQRVVIEITTASLRTGRGYTFIAVIADEIAFWPAEDAANPDTEILAAVRPGLATIPGAMLLMCSSPYARRGELWKTFRKHFGKDGARVLVWKGTSLEMNPALDPAIVAEAYEDDPASAAAEYGAEFRTDCESYISREAIDAVTVKGRTELPPVPGIAYSAFVDAAGGSGGDSFTLAIGHQDKWSDRAVLDAVREVKPPFSPVSVISEFAALLTSYGVRKVTGDRWAGEFPREIFRAWGIDYEVSPKPKSDIYRDVLPLINSQQVELLDHPKMIVQFCGLERRTARGGRDSIDHPPGSGSHDDLSNCIAGCLLTVRAPSTFFFDSIKLGPRPSPYAAARYLGGFE